MTKTPSGVCSRILTPKQVGSICWFMAAFVAMFYSQRSRKLLLDASYGWNTKKELFSLLKHILDDKYLKVASRESEDYEKFSDDTFVKVLTLLYKENSDAFPYNPEEVKSGFHSEYYIGKLYKLLGVDYKVFDYSVIGKHLYYSYLNDEFKPPICKVFNKMMKITLQPNYTLKYEEEHMVAPQVLIVIAHEKKETANIYSTYFPHTFIPEGITKTNLTSLNDKIDYLGVEYHLDSVILSNWNKEILNKGHGIAGITCKKNKFVYNGWTRTSMDPAMVNKEITRKIPCELMPYNWNIKKHGDFCLSPKKCIPEVMKSVKGIKGRNLCFNFSKGKRILVYVRKDPMRETSIETDDTTHKKPVKRVKAAKATPVVVKQPTQPKQPPKKCPDGKVLNPATGRCILSKNAAKAVKTVKDVKKPKQPNTLPKKCPDGKVLNPATGRCILSKNAAKVAKASSKDKGKVDIKKPPKKCPDGKVLNPATGRCILSKNLKK
jgi:hypothetical protein